MKQLVLIKVCLVRLEGRTLLALPKALGSSLNIHIVVHNGLTPVLKNPRPSLVSMGTIHTWCAGRTPRPIKVLKNF